MLKRVLLLAMVFCYGCANENSPLYQNPDRTSEERTKDLLSRMTVEEKVMQLDMYSCNGIIDNGKLEKEMAMATLNGMSPGSIHDFYPNSAKESNELQRFFVENTRLGIPTIFIEEGLHGYQGEKSTAFPVSLGLASMWDDAMVEEVGKVVGTEARSVGVHLLLAPTLGIGREPRWGRVEETYGEDPYLAAQNGVAYVKGFQKGDIKRDDAVIAEPKHFGVHSVPESGYNTASINVSEREARENFLYVFERAVKEGGALGIMAAYHEWDGVPAAGDERLLTGILRDEWGFKGMVISDLGAIAKQENAHRTAANPKEAIITSLKAGMNMQFYDYSHEVFMESILEALEEGSFTMDELDRAVFDVLYLKFELGLFENPYMDESLMAKRYHTEESQQLALETARKSIIMLKNDNSILPLDPSKKKIALIGEMAEEANLGGYSPKKVEGVSLLEALEESDFEVNYLPISTPANAKEELRKAILRTPDGQEGVLAEYFNNEKLEGKPSFSQVEKKLSNYWHNLSPAGGIQPDNFSVRWSGYIEPEISGLYDFSLVADDYARFILEEETLIDQWGPEQKNQWGSHSVQLQRGKRYAFRLEFAELDHYAGVKFKCQITPTVKKSETMYAAAVKAVKQADVAILMLGESEDEVGEGKDRLDLQLNANSKRLIREVQALGTPLVLVLQNGRPLAITDELPHLDAVLETWYVGEKQGQAIKEILTGEVNPSGKLPITVARHVGQLPVYYNKKISSAGGYVDGSNQPLFPFGHGLSYSTYEYTDLQFGKTKLNKGEKQMVTFNVKNTSKTDGEEIVQLYVRDEVSSVATPGKKLRKFQRVHLPAGSSKTVTFELTDEDLCLMNRQMQRVVEPGTFKIMIGASSEDIRLEKTFEVR
ncbi:glycoside hydrolase family 3 N-terminal domain-containing protein [Persicobacter diffluens]|uniref:Beta-glucosidase n=1 Tax=Persicobacter diffluens TaxID=981 RepID=A0AAN5ALZ6_9BACT|nr:beta-glucosidase [Persicobacter diffluens]